VVNDGVRDDAAVSEGHVPRQIVGSIFGQKRLAQNLGHRGGMKDVYMLAAQQSAADRIARERLLALRRTVNRRRLRGGARKPRVP
jgi:hypothetical protein